MPFSLFPRLKQLRLPSPSGVLQLGASWGQEMQAFLTNGIQAGVFVEPLPEPFAHLSSLCRSIPNFVAVNTLCAETSGKAHTFHVASNGGQSSSILPPGKHKVIYPGVKFERTIKLISSTVDDLLSFLIANGYGDVVDRLDLMYLDCQGAEFQIFQGSTRSLSRFKYVYTEVMRDELYSGQVSFSSLLNYLDAGGFTLNDVYFGYPEQAGNALFIRKDLVTISV